CTAVSLVLAVVGAGDGGRVAASASRVGEMVAASETASGRSGRGWASERSVEGVMGFSTEKEPVAASVTNVHREGSAPAAEYTLPLLDKQRPDWGGGVSVQRRCGAGVCCRVVRSRLWACEAA